MSRAARTTRRTVERYAAEIRGPAVRIYPSLANFVLIDCGRPSTALYERLLERGVIVRPMAVWSLPNHLRLSVARDEDVPRVIGAVNEVLAT